MKFALALVPDRIGVFARRLAVVAGLPIVAARIKGTSPNRQVHLARLLILILALLMTGFPGHNRSAAQTGCTPLYTYPGSLDTCFGTNGLVETSVSTTANTANDVGIQADGKVVVAMGGRNASGIGTDFFAVRYNTDGTVDPSFGGTGVVQVTFTATLTDYEYLNALAIQPDGKLLLVGSVPITNNRRGMAVARLNPADGGLDTTFGSGTGKVLFSFGNNSVGANDVALQADGKIVLVGSQSSTVWAVARLNANGSLDSTFGDGGKVTASAGKNTSDGVGGAYAAAIQTVTVNNIAEERIVVAGGRPSTTPSQSRDFALMRFRSNGALDSSFGSGGKVFTDFYGDLDRAQAVAVVGDKIIAGGIVRRNGQWGGADFGLAKYNLDGTLDGTFGGGSGKVATDINGTENFINGLTIQPIDGKIVAAGETFATTPTGSFGVVRYNDDGSLDTTFGAGGIVTSDFTAGRDAVTGNVALQADGKIVAAGTTNGGAHTATARYMP